jgi:hypothetical protein
VIFEHENESEKTLKGKCTEERRKRQKNKKRKKENVFFAASSFLGE